jgi:ribonuclease BN (tRNA processing enzyme)
MTRSTPGFPVHVGVIGSGVLLPDDARRSSGHWVSAEATGDAETEPEAEAFRLLLDCGSGTLHGMGRDGLPWQELSHIALSHFHADHIGDLAPVLWALRWGARGEDGGSRGRTLRILGPAGLQGRMEGLAAAFGGWVLDPGFPLAVHEVEPGERWRDAAAGLELVAHPVRHSPEALAWRVEARGTGVGYTGDTGPLPELGSFFRGVRVLVAECALRAPDDLNLHLSPESLARIAQAAAPDVLVPVHLYPEVNPEELPDLLRDAGYTGRVEMGRDGLALAAGSAGVRIPSSPHRST